MPLPELSLERHTSTESLRRYYRKPPIQEAILEVVASLPAESQSQSKLQKVGARFSKHYPQQQPLEATATGETAGFEFRSVDQREAVRARTDSFSYHRLSPYTAWEEWSAKAFALLEEYLRVTSAISVSRIAVRYVNNIGIPSPGELADYFLTYPEIAAGLPQAVAGFYLQATIPLPQHDTFVVLRQGMIQPPPNMVAAIILDIQALQRVNLSAASFGEVRSIAERLHEYEIATFERCITNRTRELFQ